MNNFNKKNGIIQAKSSTAAQLFSPKGKREYVVPDFQRSFSWTKENVNDLWDDLTEAIKRDQNHFLGSVVLQKKKSTKKSGSNPEKFCIYDGQQRLTVVTAIVATIYHASQKIKEMEKENKSHVNLCDKIIKQAEDFLYLPDTNKKLILTLSVQDRVYFRECVSKNNTENIRNNKSNDFLKKHVFQNLKSKIKLKIDSCESIPEMREYLQKLIDSACNNFYFVVIEVGNCFSAATLFETMNFRGSPLKPEDLFKSLILSKAEQQKELKNVRNEWKEITDIADKKKISLSNFLRVFWIAKNAKLVEGNLYRQFKKDLENEPKDLFNNSSDPVKVNDYVADIRQHLTIYVELLYPKPGKQAGESLKAIKLLKGEKYAHPFLVAAYLKEKRLTGDKKKDFCNLRSKSIFAIEAFALREHICASSKSAEIQKIFIAAIGEMQEDPLNALKQVIVNLKNVFPTNSNFEECFSKYTARRKHAMYILDKIERHYSPKTEAVSSDPQKINLEHIMPQKIGRGWAHVKNYHKDYLNRLGNLTLIAKELNVTNCGFTPKKNKYYKESHIEITKKLCEYNEWRKKEINDRQKKLAKIASVIWDIKP